ncbi:glycoside hydrolase family 16 protein [Arachnia propionica]|uniref:Glycoside hydrolase family 16 protein n=2 Tax=Arachnia propionica TaxID=1750 RepID=A0A3P1T5S4_9ACTN|nr:glycoside hydrolase family 16 protein [Arachnia propionica]
MNRIRKLMRRTTTLALISGLIGAGTLFTDTAVERARANTTPVDQNYALVWQDEFNGSEIDSSRWEYQTGPWGSSGVQNCYTKDSDNVSVGNGTLKITALHEPGTRCGGQVKDFTSGFLQTKNRHSWTYGYFEARVKLPTNGSSTWPAFWMSPEKSTYGSWPRSGEIDVFEAKGFDKKFIAANAHWGINDSKRRQQPGHAPVADVGQWHTYGVKWEPGKLEYYLDGKLFHTIDNFRSPNATSHPGPFNIPFYLRLNMAVGGTYLRPHSDANQSLDKLPAVMEVDHVRVWQKQQAPATKAPVRRLPIKQSSGSTVALTFGEECLNIAGGSSPYAPHRLGNDHVVRETVRLRINCDNQQPATGYTTRVTLKLTKLYPDTGRLRLATVVNRAVEEDLTGKVSYGTSADGKYTMATYHVTDGGFGDEDGRANGTILHSTAIYEG